MQKMILVTMTLLLMTLTSISTDAQSTEKKEDEKPTTTTADAWRDAVPQNDQPSTQPVVVMEESKDNVEGEENAAETEKRIIDLEQRLIEALKQRDSVTLKLLLADDFLLAGVNIPGTKTDKARYIDWVLKKLELKTYNSEKTTMRVSPAMVVVTTNFKRQAIIAGAPSDGDFTITNVWFKSEMGWQLVSHHISQSSKL